MAAPQLGEYSSQRRRYGSKRGANLYTGSEDGKSIAIHVTHGRRRSVSREGEANKPRTGRVQTCPQQARPRIAQALGHTDYWVVMHYESVEGRGGKHDVVTSLLENCDSKAHELEK